MILLVGVLLATFFPGKVVLFPQVDVPPVLGGGGGEGAAWGSGNFPNWNNHEDCSGGENGTIVQGTSQKRHISKRPEKH